jgi:PAS domain S-box-containing protein
MQTIITETKYKPLTNCMNTQAWLFYLKSHGYPTEDILSDIDHDEVFLMDDANWISTDQCYKLASNISITFPEEDQLFHKIAVWSTQKRITKSIWALTGSTLSTYQLYNSLPKTIMRFNRHRKCEVEHLSKDKAIIKFKHMTKVKALKEICDWTGGLLKAAPLTIGYPLSHVVKIGCECDGEEYCSYKVEWKEKLNIFERIRNILFFREKFNKMQSEALEESFEKLLDRFEKLQASEEKHRLLVETIRDIVYTVDLEGKINYIGPMTEKIIGYSENEIIGRKFEEFLPVAQRKEVRKDFENNLKAETANTYQVGFVTKAKREIPVEIHSSMLFDAQGQPIGRIGVARDISRRIQQEEKRKEVEIKSLAQDKLASLGEIATGVAHEINQPLSYIKIILESTLNDLANKQLDTKELDEDFHESLRQIGKITKIISHLRTFGRSDMTSFNPVSLPWVIEDTMILMKERLRIKNISINKQITDNLPLVYGNHVKLEQVFINLLQNSMDALEEQGKGEIDLVMDQADDNVIVRFSDNGKGIPSEVLERIFEPFYTTKDVDKGTGIGLSIIYGIIQELHGTVTCESTEGQGTTFEIRLPVYVKDMEDRLPETSNA